MISLASIVFAVIPAPLALPLQAAPPERHHLAELSLQDAKSVRAAHDAGVALDCQSRLPGGRAEITVTDRQLAELQRRGALVRVTQPDLEKFYAARLEARPPRRPSPAIDWAGGSMGGYFTLAEVEALLDQFATDYPSICSAKFSLGQSVEGRELWAVKVSDQPGIDENEPEARFDSLHHAREPVGMHATLYFLDWLLSNYGSDPLATHLVDEREIWFIPVVNPDGYEYNRAIAPNGGGLWRKNRRDNGDGTFGVDLNRNYSYQWGYDNSGSSGNTGSETYRGPSAASEPETQAMEAFLSSREFATSISAHTYSNLWLFPWGYDCFDPPQRSAFDGIAEWFTVENGYVHGTICQALYSANGNTVDYDHGVLGTWSGTVEIGGNGDGFWPAASRIIPLIEENLRGFQRIALYAAAGLESSDWSWQESTGDGDVWLDPGEEFDLALTLRNIGTLATNGAATVTVSTSAADVVVIDGFHDFGTIAAFAQSDNLALPLRVQIAPGATAGQRIVVQADLSYDGFVESHAVEFLIGEPSRMDDDDLEINLGWIAGDASDTAVNGRFEIADPQLTTSGGNTSQPADDHTASGTLCAVTDGRAGSSAGTYDVDSGKTTLYSPQFDLEDSVAPLVSYWRWFTNLTNADDAFVVSISADGGATWSEVERVTGNRNSWQQVRFDPAAYVALTDRMQLRFVVADDPNNSLTEALVDDLGFDAFPTGRVMLWRYGSARPGGSLRLHVQGVANQSFVLWGAQSGGSLFLKKLGLLELDAATMIPVLADTTGPSGRYTLIADLPADPTLSGVEIHVQPLVLDPAGAYLGNAIDFVIE